MGVWRVRPKTANTVLAGNSRFPRQKKCALSKSIPDTRWIFFRGKVDAAKGAKARSVAEGYQGPDLRDGSADKSGRVRLRTSNLEVISLGDLGKWSIGSLDIKNAFSQADGFGCKVFLRAGVGWNPEAARRIRKSLSPACGSDRYLLNFASSSARAGLKLQASSSEPCSHFISRRWQGGRLYRRANGRYPWVWRI